MQQKYVVNTHSNSSFSLIYTFRFEIKYGVQIGGERAEDLRSVMAHVAQQWQCRIVTMTVADNAVSITIEAHPNLRLSTLAGNMKTVSARYMRKQHPEIRKAAGGFWERRYSVVTREAELARHHN